MAGQAGPTALEAADLLCGRPTRIGQRLILTLV
jgi:hypothetical protein